jgi:hypothetical protein
LTCPLLRATGSSHPEKDFMMHRYFIILAGLGLATAAQASSTYRVNNQVLAAGDSAVRVTDLLGKPSYKSHSHASRSGSSGRRARGTRVVNDAAKGEQWQYRRDDHVIVVTIVDGRVSDIEDRRR